MSDETVEHGFTPSASTIATAGGALLAATIMLVLEQFGIHAPAGYEALLGGFIAAAAGYLPKSGRQRI